MCKTNFVNLLGFNSCPPKWPSHFMSTLMALTHVDLKIFDLNISTISFGRLTTVFQQQNVLIKPNSKSCGNASFEFDTKLIFRYIAWSRRIISFWTSLEDFFALLNFWRLDPIWKNGLKICTFSIPNVNIVKKVVRFLCQRKIYIQDYIQRKNVVLLFTIL
jgi:hypothetical protein